LILVGILMMQSISEIDLRDFAIAVPAVLTIVLMPLTFSISEGLALGFVIYAVFMLGAGRTRQVSGMAWILAALFLAHLVLR
jgi:AGZA family xanthine/uracil permease-like MFS transporter